MDPTSALTSFIIRKSAWLGYGWFAKAHYNRVFRVYWERKETEMHLASSDWRRIFREANNIPDKLYISAGELFFMGPLIEEILKMPECRKCIKGIYIKRMSEALFLYLTDNKPFLPVVQPNLLQDFDSKVRQLSNCFEGEVNIGEWKRLPNFSGAMYGDYLMYHSWRVDRSGFLTHKSDMRFMKREYDKEDFKSYSDLIMEGF